MKFKYLPLLFLSISCLVGCDNQCKHIDENPKDHFCDLCHIELSKHEDTNGDGYCNYCGAQMSTPTPQPQPDAKRSPFVGGVVDDGVHKGYEFSIEGATRQESGQASVEIFGMNDFHGSVLPTELGEDSLPEAGLIRMGTFMKAQTNKENTLFFDQGDTWQGSLESNTNRGELVQKVFAAAGLNLRTVGNHDFDWGVERLMQTNAIKYNNYSIPCLAANVYDFDWETKTVGETQQSDIGLEYAAFTVENGLKIGVVGVIGSSQITSISTQMVKNITFTDHFEKIKEMSDYLRTDKDCDIVMATMHDAYDEYTYEELTDISENSGKRYVDLVFNGHSHQNVLRVQNNVIFSQWGRNSEYAGSVKLTYDFDTESVIPSVEEDRTSYNAKYMNTYYSENDKDIEKLVNASLSEVESLRNQVLSENFVGFFDGSNLHSLPNLMAEAIFEEAKDAGIDIDISVCNDARASIDKTTVTYSDIYRSFPFDNEIPILQGKCGDAAASLTRNSTCHEGPDTLDSQQVVKVAALDYLAFHCNYRREYNYFVGFEEVGYLMSGGKRLTYRDVLASYLLKNQDKTFDAYEYETASRFNLKIHMLTKMN